MQIPVKFTSPKKVHSYLRGMQVHCCGEASFHLQEMKDKLIIIINDLLDNGDELPPERFQELRLER